MLNYLQRNMSKNRSFLIGAGLVAAFALMSSGCATVQSLTGVSTGGGGGAAGGGNPAEAVTETFNSFTTSDCDEARTDPFECAREFVEKAGLIPEGSYIENHRIFNAKDEMDNLSERWIPGWDKLPSGNGTEQIEYVYGTIASAAMRKNWYEECQANYKKMHTETLTKADADIAAKIEEARASDNLHERIRALTKLRAQFDSEVGPYPRDFGERLVHTVGGRYELEVAIFEELRKADRDVLYHSDYIGPESELVALMRPRMSLEKESEAYCRHASVHGADGLVPIDTYTYAEFSSKVYTDEQRKEVKAELKELKETSAKKFALSDEAKEKLEKVDDSQVAASTIEEGENGPVVVWSKTDEETKTLGCQDLDTIKKRHADGRIEYDKKCRYADRNRTIRKRFHMPPMPEGVELKEGSNLSLIHFRRDYKTESKANPDSKADDVIEIYELDVLYVTEIDNTELVYSE